jgi:hypothetical protein
VEAEVVRRGRPAFLARSHDLHKRCKFSDACISDACRDTSSLVPALYRQTPTLQAQCTDDLHMAWVVWVSLHRVLLGARRFNIKHRPHPHHYLSAPQAPSSIMRLTRMLVP